MGSDGNAKGRHIGGREATHMAIENDKRRPTALDPAPGSSVDSASRFWPLEAVVTATAKTAKTVTIPYLRFLQ